MAMAASAMACASSAPPLSSSSSSSPSFSSSSTPAPIPRQVHFPSSIPNTSLSTTPSTSPHDPSLQFANMMWFKGPYNTQIFVGENEPADSVVRRFRRAVMQAGIIAECRRRRFFETPQDIAKRKLQAAQRRRSKSRFLPRGMTDPRKTSQTTPAADDDDNDNWEYDEVA
ncbi:hypothetical protein GOP47_0012327 [Adiantum capillus-veneris]|uniref:30S ribosomal protein S21, chloroplastic n=1 Tax=Adiantum capillus-veneris TaxID=13818 RepID=A0A9D4ZGR7_ADICA|nr:hypothetical protein GOP47_0012327 [Adiantum capillus-veneris]